MADQFTTEKAQVAEIVNKALHAHVCGPWPAEVCCWTEEVATCAETVAQMPGMGRAVEYALAESGLVTTAADALREYADLAASREHHMSAPRFKSAADGRERNVWGLVAQELRQRADRLSNTPATQGGGDRG